MTRKANFWQDEAHLLHGPKRLAPFKGPDEWRFFENIELTDEEMADVEDWKLKKSQWLKLRGERLADFKAVIFSATNVEDLEEVLPLEPSYFAPLKKKNQALAVSGAIVKRVKSSTLEPAT